MTTVTLESVRKEFDDVTAVSGASLSVREGEFVVLVGPSGCGKSTTLRLLAGLETPTDGTVQFGDRVVNDLEPKDRNVAMVFQNYALYPHMSAKRNMTFGLQSARDIDDGEVDRRVAETAEMLDIADLLDRKPGALSGGEKQRVAIGRALLRDPDVLLMDEPLSNLDAKLRVQMRAELAELHSRLQTTTVYVTHDQVEAMTLGERIAVMRDGEIQQVDRPQRVYDVPANRFVAEFIGDPGMNTLEVDVTRRGDDFVADHPAFTLTLPESQSLVDRDVRRAVLGVRPEDFTLADDDPGNDTITAEVTVREPLGDTVLMHGTVGDDELKVQLEPRSDVSPGEAVTFTADPDRLHLFHPETGTALYHSARADATEADLVPEA